MSKPLSLGQIDLSRRDVFREYKLANNGEILKDLSKVNIFVGENNSGKSRFLRALSVFADIAFIPPDIDLSKPNNRLNQFREDLEGLFSSFKILDFDGILELTDKVERLDSYLVSGKEYFSGLDKIKEVIEKPKGRVTARHAVVHYVHDRDSQKLLQEALRKLFIKLEEDLAVYFPLKSALSQPFKRVYIPTLRGFRPLTHDGSDLYASRTNRDYFTNSSRPPLIFTGYELYTQLQRLLLGEQRGRILVKYFESFLSKNFFQNKQVTLIPYLPTAEDPQRQEVYINIGGDEKPVYDLGDGIQQIILLTFLCYEYADEPALFFIEEPELFLHPGMQRLLLECFSSFENHQFFLVSHSNHFLDISVDQKNISIFTFRREAFEGGSNPKFQISNVSSGNDNALKLLGVKNSSVFLSNCTIWVEGLTDRLYFKHYLKLYQEQLPEGAQKFTEDLHYSFVEYGGSNITHWSFLDSDSGDPKMNAERLCGKLFLITDRDDESKNDRKQILQDTLGERYYCLRKREVENLLSKKVLLLILREYKEKDFKEFEETEYAEESLGRFIDERVLNSRIRKTVYADKSGTVKDKDVFCRKAITHLQDFNDLSEEARDLTIKIYNFIVEENRF